MGRSPEMPNRHRLGCPKRLSRRAVNERRADGGKERGLRASGKHATPRPLPRGVVARPGCVPTPGRTPDPLRPSHDSDRPRASAVSRVAERAVTKAKVALLPGATRTIFRNANTGSRTGPTVPESRWESASGSAGLLLRPRNFPRSVSCSVHRLADSSEATRWMANTGFSSPRTRRPHRIRIVLGQPLGFEEQLAERRVGEIGSWVV